MAILDLRRTDQRTNVLENPVWITSGIFDATADDGDALLFSFPINAKYGYFCLQEVCIETIVAFTGGTIVFTLGSGTLATDAITTGGAVSVVDADFYCTTFAKAGMASTGVTFPDAGALVTLKAAGKTTAIACADSTVPCIYGDLSSSAAITAGQARVHILGSYVPTV